MVQAGASERQQAFAELGAGQKRGHWIWWVFPALAAQGGDVYSARQMEGGADLADLAEAQAYLGVPQLRDAYLQALGLADVAMARHRSRAPFRVFDAAFGRQAAGTWVRGPVDSFKVRCSATLFAVAAKLRGDGEVHAGCLKVLGHFVGDCAYTPGGPGTAGYDPGGDGAAAVLQGPDQRTLQLCGSDWAAVSAPSST